MINISLAWINRCACALSENKAMCVCMTNPQYRDSKHQFQFQCQQNSSAHQILSTTNKCIGRYVHALYNIIRRSQIYVRKLDSSQDDSDLDPD